MKEMAKYFDVQLDNEVLNYESWTVSDNITPATPPNEQVFNTDQATNQLTIELLAIN